MSDDRTLRRRSPRRGPMRVHYGGTVPGPLGPQGPQGATGATGATGPTGPAGSSSTAGQASVTLAAGVNNNVALTATGMCVATFGLNTPGPSTITGFQPPSVIPAGQSARMRFYLSAGQPVTFTHRDSRTTAGGRINTISGASITFQARAGGLTVTFEYDSAAQEWVIGDSGFLDKPYMSFTDDFGVNESNTSAQNDAAYAAALAFQAADIFRRPLFQRRVIGTGSAHYEISKPLEFNYSGAIVEFENNTSPIRSDGFIGPLMIFGPALTAPTPTQDGTTGYWGVTFSGSIGAYLLLSTTHHGLNLNQSALTIEEEWNPTDFSTQGAIFVSSGRRGAGEPTTTGARITITSAGNVRVDFTTSGSGYQSVTGTTVLTTGHRHSIAASYDGTKMRVYIDGNFETGIAATGAIVQGSEVVVLGGESRDWPASGPIISPPKGILYCVRVYNVAKYTAETAGAYVPPASEPTTTGYDGHGDNCLLLLNFDPSYNGTAAAGPSAWIKGLCQRSSVGVNANTPVYFPWRIPGNSQIGGPILRNVNVLSALGGPGIWISQCPGSYLENVTITGATLTLYNNCYESWVNGVNIQMGSGVGIAAGWASTPQNGVLANEACTVLRLDKIKVTGATGYSICLFNAAGAIDTPYLISNGFGNLLLKAVGEMDIWEIDNFAAGDEAGLTTDHVIYVTSSSLPAAVNLTMRGGGFNWLQTNGRSLVDIDQSGGSIELFTNFWGSTTNTNTRAIRFLNQPTRPVVVGCDQQVTQSSAGNALIPWMPETTEVGALAGTATFTAGSTTVLFTTPQSLQAGALITSSNQAGIFYRIAANTSASTSATITQPFTGTTASGQTATIVGQGPIVFREFENWGQSPVNYASDADRTLLVNEYRFRNIKLTGTISATRKAIAPLVAGDRRRVQNATTGGQSVTWIGPSGTGVTFGPGFQDVYCDGTNWLPG